METIRFEVKTTAYVKNGVQFLSAKDQFGNEVLVRRVRGFQGLQFGGVAIHWDRPDELLSLNKAFTMHCIKLFFQHKEP